jgi:hypothetical protein
MDSRDGNLGGAQKADEPSSIRCYFDRERTP